MWSIAPCIALVLWHTLPACMAYPAMGAWLLQSNVAGPLHMPRSSQAALTENLVHWTLGLVVADGHWGLGNVGWVVPCSHCAPWWYDSILWACGKMPIPSSQMLRCLLSGWLLLALATRSVSTWWAHHLTHCWGSLKDGSGIEDQSESSPPPPGDPVPERNSWTHGSSSGGVPSH